MSSGQRHRIEDWADAARAEIAEWEAEELRKLEEWEAVWGADSSPPLDAVVLDRFLSRIRDALSEED